MKNCMNVAAGVFGVMVPVALLVCGWDVLAPERHPSYPPSEQPIQPTKRDRYVGKNWFRTEDKKK